MSDPDERTVDMSDPEDDVSEGRRRPSPPQPVVTCPNCEEETLQRLPGSYVWKCSNCGYEETR